MLTDTHCHLDFDAFASDREAVIDASRKEGIKYLLNPAVSIESTRNILALSEVYPEIYAAVGVHPNDNQSWDREAIKILREFCNHSKVVSIGEIGLDYYRKSTPREKQIRTFQDQLELAAEMNKPVIIHCREAHKDLFAILSQWVEQLQQSHASLASAPGVLHSFSGSLEDALLAQDLHFYLGVNGVITFEKAENLRAIIKNTPLDRILIETDAPFLTPPPYRGKRNQPAYVKFVAEKLAVLYNTTTETIMQQTTSNAADLFHWGDKNVA